MKKVEVKIAVQTLEILKTKEWSSITTDLIFKKLKLQSTKIVKIKNNNDLIKNIIKYFDELLKKEANSIEKSNSQDMLFEIFMIRFDLLNTYRSGIIKIFKNFKSHPKDFVNILPYFIESINLMVKLANLQKNRLKDTIKIKCLLIIYFATFLTWIKDESDSLDKTMNVLSNYLERAEKILTF